MTYKKPIMDFLIRFLAKDADSDGALEDGEYTLVAEVTDDNGKKATATSVFTIVLPVPAVSIDTPVAGQVYAHGGPIITGSLSGAAEVTGTLTITDADDVKVVEQSVKGNEFSYEPSAADALGHGRYTVKVVVTDLNMRKAEASADFTIDIPGPSVALHAVEMYDVSRPVIKGEYSVDDATMPKNAKPHA